MRGKRLDERFRMADTRRKRPAQRRAVAVRELMAGPLGFEAIVGRGDLLSGAGSCAGNDAWRIARMNARCLPRCLYRARPCQGQCCR